MHYFFEKNNAGEESPTPTFIIEPLFNQFESLEIASSLKSSPEFNISLTLRQYYRRIMTLYETRIGGKVPLEST
ncbi:hypothetical protein SAMN03080599_03261 [Acidaminobacter hydrogenoformans DSM 2784]|uniref:Uncharacterized protein n=1 Tax=Acidaminobacter hydrogenoformans DSM 2784 TaxID=1120920 RepID=A0A1G5S7B5_9FIRM|nr:hypothetical protein SAMN03080599_03261 [Acidaminobacter hydrogenoformans DSM 2784]